MLETKECKHLLGRYIDIQHCSLSHSVIKIGKSKSKKRAKTKASNAAEIYKIT